MNWLVAFGIGIVVGYYFRSFSAWWRERSYRRNFKPVGLRVYRPASNLKIRSGKK